MCFGKINFVCNKKIISIIIAIDKAIIEVAVYFGYVQCKAITVNSIWQG